MDNESSKAGSSELYSRAETVTQQITSAFFRTFNEKKMIFELGIESHKAWEKKSGDGRTFHVTMNVFAPLFSTDNEMTAIIGSSTIERLT
jgi:hypothetical protein